MKVGSKNIMQFIKSENSYFSATGNCTNSSGRKTRIFGFYGLVYIFESNFHCQQLDNIKRHIFSFYIMMKKCELASKNAKMCNIFLFFYALYKLLNKSKMVIHWKKLASVKVILKIPSSLESGYRSTLESKTNIEFGLLISELKKK